MFGGSDRVSQPKFIVVEIDTQLKDCGVFTGQVQIVESRMIVGDYGALQVMDGVSSRDIEHAFLFNMAWDAWRFAMQFQPHWNAEANRFWGFRRWRVRRDGDYFPGECRQGVDVGNPMQHGKTWIPQEALLAAASDSLEQGYRSARREAGTLQEA